MPTWLDKILNSQFVMIGLAGLAFLIALWLVIVIVRMLTGGRLRMSSGRTRQARLGIVDAFDLDRQRQLIIVRRDNTEHLIMIGGPNDLVIESEIVRIEARDNRRGTDKIEGIADARIPAPTMSAEAGSSSADADEPMLPMALPSRTGPEYGDASAERAEVLRTEPVVAEPVRTPTFPLPPRRPAPPAERRPPPLPESVSRSDDRSPATSASSIVPPPTRQDPASLPASVDAPIPVAPVAPLVPALRAPPETREDVPLRPPVRTPPSFLKPLPPRPPIRPLRRATPVVPGAPAADAAAIPKASDESIAAPPAAAPVLPVTEPAPTVLPPVAEAPGSPEAPLRPAPPIAKSEETNPLESLEEEMAKLLGRG